MDLDLSRSQIQNGLVADLVLIVSCSRKITSY
jgi:hypothetical protein